jgi:hypothetical protein
MNEHNGLLIKEGYARRGWILELHLSHIFSSTFVAFRIYAQRGIGLHYLQAAVPFVIFHFRFEKRCIFC